MSEVAVLDTNALIRLFKGTGKEIERALMKCARLAIPLTVYGEFLSGLKQGAGTTAEQTVFNEMLAMPVFHKVQ